MNKDDDIFYSAEDYSSIYVSRYNPESIKKLEQELDNEKRYSKRYISGIKVRERFVSKVFCIDCNSNMCNPGPMPLWHHRSIEIKGNKCGFVYHPNHQN